MTSLTARTSTIVIASGGKTRVYHSLAAVPPVLRQKLEKSTNGSHSATILIADRRGREELVRALQGHATELLSRRDEPASAAQSGRRRLNPAKLVGILIPLLLGLSAWLFVGTRY
jgi:hypothetical protein